METVIIVIHLMVVAALVGVVLMQRSEGGALGIGGGGNFMQTRGTGNVLTRATAILATAFFATSIILTLLARYASGPTSILSTDRPAGQEGVLDQLPAPLAPLELPQLPGGDQPAATPAPAEGAAPAATPAPAANPAPAGEAPPAIPNAQ